MRGKARRTTLAFMSAAALVAAAVIFVAPVTAHPRGSRHRPGLSERQILRIAERAAAQAGDPRPTLVQHSEGTRHNANLVDSGDGVTGRRWSYLIAERGDFVLRDVGIGNRTIRGSVITLIVDARTREVTDYGLGNRYPDLDQLGPVHTDLRR